MPTLFRPCIDLRNGKVTQIVGATLKADSDERSKEDEPTVNYVSEQSPSHYAKMYKDNDLKGGHVILLGSGCENAAKEALLAYPNGLHIGGGMNADNCEEWLKLGAEKIIVTSWLFVSGSLELGRLNAISKKIGPENLVVDLSCRRMEEGGWNVVTDKWQTITKHKINRDTLEMIAPYCSEFLIHGVDVEGTCTGMDRDLISLMGEISPLPCTYAGGCNSISDLAVVENLSEGKVDVTIGSALDIFGGRTVRFEECCAYNRKVLGARQQPDTINQTMENDKNSTKL